MYKTTNRWVFQNVGTFYNLGKRNEKKREPKTVQEVYASAFEWLIDSFLLYYAWAYRRFSSAVSTLALCWKRVDRNMSRQSSKRVPALFLPTITMVTDHMRKKKEETRRKRHSQMAIDQRYSIKSHDNQWSVTLDPNCRTFRCVGVEVFPAVTKQSLYNRTLISEFNRKEMGKLRKEKTSSLVT